MPKGLSNGDSSLKIPCHSIQYNYDMCLVDLANGDSIIVVSHVSNECLTVDFPFYRWDFAF